MNEIFPNQTEPVTPVQTQVKPSYKVHNWIALIYVILLAITFFNNDEGVANILFFIMAGFGLVAGIGFIIRMFKVGHSVQNSLARVFLYFVGIGGGIVIFIIAGFVALIGVLKHIHFGF